jgi:hypothetical protein
MTSGTNVLFSYDIECRLWTYLLHQTISAISTDHTILRDEIPEALHGSHSLTACNEVLGLPVLVMARRSQ